ncbi:aminotransferase class V-fold PLP-dependent enzyme [Flavitalea sp. BT771]|uniref:aminotransferase class V-fold PLP-dependent enzyme n=1 Tax=Flavitalea sp. BT771 TaxID=3063329 RepID=UPI0026E470F7|nr:aminotransferase class V-fold PLP-dependent enzyme [Flavitalea sp. BT771]MDO6435706.1 aminotransferase class V-fold PLP-dependent enzyme [Flavitalea sp. BT771]MDV6224607.1 aminotransferase class V-fold PLP-dependent enzyme [Flavitalea sp. BT771]
MNISEIRKETPGCDFITHLNNAGAALMPRIVADAIRNYISEEEKYGGYETADKKSAEIEQFYDYASSLLHCKSHNIAFTTNATDSYNKALSSIPFKQNDIILTTTNDYPSNIIAFLSLQKRFGVRVILIRNTDTGEIDLEDLESKLKKHSPRLLSITHVPTSSGLVQPVERIGDVVKKHDCIYLLDACQSLGQMDINAASTGADFISGTFRKFLRGPRGAGLLYVSDKVLDKGLEPLFPDLHGADWVDTNHYKTRMGAKRFEYWEMAYALMMGSSQSLAYLFSLGIHNIEQRNKMLLHKLRTGLADIPSVKLLDRGQHRCSIVTFQLKGLPEHSAKQYFRDKGINVYTTPKSAAIIDFGEKGIDWAVRVSPHYYNTESEIDTLLEAVKAV